MDDEVVNPDRAVVTVWSDVGCPWASLALFTLRAAARRRGAELLVDHRAFPLELVNGRPTPKLVVQAEVAVIASRVPELSWTPWTAPDWTWPVTTLPALEAVQAAKETGLAASDELDAALRAALYAGSRCISVEAEVLEIAAGCPRVDLDALRHALRTGSHRGRVHEQRAVAEGDGVRGSGHVLAAGFDEHNPGVRMSWPGEHGRSFPRIEHHDPAWADRLLDTLALP